MAEVELESYNCYDSHLVLSIVQMNVKIAHHSSSEVFKKILNHNHLTHNRLKRFSILNYNRTI